MSKCQEITKVLNDFIHEPRIHDDYESERIDINYPLNHRQYWFNSEVLKSFITDYSDLIDILEQLKGEQFEFDFFTNLRHQYDELEIVVTVDSGTVSVYIRGLFGLYDDLASSLKDADNAVKRFDDLPKDAKFKKLIGFLSSLIGEINDRVKYLDNHQIKSNQLKNTNLKGEYHD